MSPPSAPKRRSSLDTSLIGIRRGDVLGRDKYPEGAFDSPEEAE
ncbi:hypothetical protein [Williamsia sp. 1138]|nr:hypothetical protein [Williamsia sp. 1138]